MTLILWTLGSMLTFGVLAVVLSIFVLRWAATDFEDLELNFEDGEGW
jgi:hypothetical protein